MMGNLREEFNRLAQKLASEAESRRQFVAQNRRESMQAREDNQREREQVARELARQARSLSQMLEHLDKHRCVRSCVSNALPKITTVGCAVLRNNQARASRPSPLFAATSLTALSDTDVIACEWLARRCELRSLRCSRFVAALPM
jgi:hypothetical protein